MGDRPRRRSVHPPMGTGERVFSFERIFSNRAHVVHPALFSRSRFLTWHGYLARAGGVQVTSGAGRDSFRHMDIIDF